MAREYRNPIPTVDVIIQLEDHPGAVVLVERKNPPYGWALPGGYVEEGEPLWVAAAREAAEETGLEVVLLEQFHTYSAPDRDPRHHTISTVYLARATGRPRAGDDAANVRIWPLDELPELAFDHAVILADYRRYQETGVRPPANR